MTQDEFRAIVKPYTMTGQLRIDCLFDSLEYVREQGIQGDYVECGVWRGGNILGIMRYLEFHQNTNSNIWLYDTFSGMTAPDTLDVDLHQNKASDILQSVMCINSLEEVQQVLTASHYPAAHMRYVIGDICETLRDPLNVPEKIALLRLDTDWYSSTKIELEVLWERLEVGAPCIIDDYGHWQGCKKAVHEFFDTLSCHHVAEEIDYTGIRIFKKC